MENYGEVNFKLQSSKLPQKTQAHYIVLNHNARQAVQIHINHSECNDCTNIRLVHVRVKGIAFGEMLPIEKKLAILIFGIQMPFQRMYNQ